MTNYPVAALISVYKNDQIQQFTQAIESLLEQDYGAQNIHIYLGIDGPIPEEIEQYIKSYSNCFHKIIRNQTNQGLAVTLNRLINAVENEKYIFRMDADDIALPFRFRLQAEFMEANPDVDVVGGGIVEFGADGNAITERYYPETHVEILQYIKKSNPLAHMTTCFRREVFEKGVLYPTNDFPEDLALWFGMLSKGFRIANIPHTLVRVRTASGYYARRNFRWAYSEMKTYLKGIRLLFGFSWCMTLPMCRFMMRCCPTFVTRAIYQSRAQFMNPPSSKNQQQKAA